MNPRVQGCFGELSAIDWLGQHGYDVFFPLMHSPDIDLIAVDTKGRKLGVQVKTSNFSQREGRWSVMLATAGGNQSWTGVIKFFSADRCDRLFVLTGDGRRWFIPAKAVEARRAISLGGPKYSQFEVEPGHPLTTSVAA